MELRHTLFRARNSISTRALAPLLFVILSFLFITKMPVRRGKKSKPKERGEERRASGKAPAGQKSLWPVVALIAMVFVAYLPVWQAKFIWDDAENITNNQTLRSLDGLRQMWLVPESIQQY